MREKILVYYTGVIEYVLFDIPVANLFSVSLHYWMGIGFKVILSSFAFHM